MIYENSRSPSLGERKGLYRERDLILGACVHSTGSGVISRWRREAEKYPRHTPLDTTVRIYTQILEVAPHYVVGQCGRVVQVTDEALAAWHVGSKGAQVYRRPSYKAPLYWRKRWPQYESPVELLGGKLWSTGRANDVLLGVEVVPPVENPQGGWSEECLFSLRELLLDKCGEHGFPCHEEYLIGHYDARPEARERNGVPWDPWEVQWSPSICRALICDVVVPGRDFNTNMPAVS